MSSHFSFAVDRASEPGDAALASPEVNRSRRWRGGIALAALATALFSVVASADDERRFELNTHRFADTLAAQHPIKNHARNKDRGK